MTITAASFRAALPAFTDATQFPDSDITFWITLAYKLHNADKIGDMVDDLVTQYVAHQCVLEAQSRNSVAAGGLPGLIVGNVTNASADGVSYTRSLQGATLDADAGDWNLTIYGIRWRTMYKLFGAGPVQVGVPCPEEGESGAWPGPYPSPW
jgi:hypothetical protein